MNHGCDIYSSDIVFIKCHYILEQFQRIFQNIYPLKIAVSKLNIHITISGFVFGTRIRRIAIRKLIEKHIDDAWMGRLQLLDDAWMQKPKTLGTIVTVLSFTLLGVFGQGTALSLTPNPTKEVFELYSPNPGCISHWLQNLVFEQPGLC